MLHFLSLPGKHGPIKRYFGSWGADLRSRVRFHSYDQIAAPGDLPAGTYIFTDVDRLSPAEQAHAESIWDKLAERGEAVRLLNHPGRTLRRYDLLRRLHEAGINRFNAYRLDEIGPGIRFPVYLRFAERHTGALTRLLKNPASLEAAIDRQLAKGRDRHSLIAIEFLDTSEDGLFRKYGAFRVGEAVLAHHLMFEREWQVRGPGLAEPSMAHKERVYVTENPHRAELAEIFRLAGIDFGRVDYGLLDGRIQVWEINTNPQILYEPETYGPEQLATRQIVAARLNEALRAIDRRGAPPGFLQRMAAWRRLARRRHVRR